MRRKLGGVGEFHCFFVRSYACSYCRVPGGFFFSLRLARGSIKILQFKERMLAFGQNKDEDEGQPTHIFQPRVRYNTTPVHPSWRSNRII